MYVALTLNTYIVVITCWDLTDTDYDFTGQCDINITGQCNITFPAGETVATLNVSITDDMEIEEIETLCLSINKDMLHHSLVRAEPYNVTITIKDNDDCKYVHT